MNNDLAAAIGTFVLAAFNLIVILLHVYKHH